MNSILNNLGIILVIIGVLCLILYAVAVPSNVLLVLALVFEVAGIFSYIFQNKK